MVPAVRLGLWVALTSPAAGVSDITIVDASVALSPSQLDYEAGYVEDTAPGGILVRVSTDNAAGIILYIRCDDGSPEISLTDLLVKCPTSGTSMASYTPITGSDQDLWSTSSTCFNEDVYTDVRIQNLWVYPDADGGGTTAHTDALTYTVVEQ